MSVTQPQSIHLLPPLALRDVWSSPRPRRPSL